MVGAYRVPPLDILINGVVYAVMKIVVLEVLEVATAMGGREELTAEVSIGIHRASHIHKEKQLHRVFPITCPDELKLASILAGGVDCLW
jgi:hypothetical protein